MTSVTPLISELLDREDAFDANATAALAILDCVRVLCALERATAIDSGDLTTGRGYASGECVRDASIPAALYHAFGLVERMRDTGSQAMAELKVAIR